MDLGHHRVQLLPVGDVDGHVENGEAIAGGADVQVGYAHLAHADGRGNVHQQVVPVLADHLQGGGVVQVGVLPPADSDPPAGLLLLVLRGGVGAVLPVDADPVAPGDEADDIVPGHRGAALGKFHQAIGEALHDDALLALGADRGLGGLLFSGGDAPLQFTPGGILPPALFSLARKRCQKSTQRVCAPS